MIHCNVSTPKADTTKIPFLFPFTAVSIGRVLNTMNLFSGNAPTENIYFSACTIANCQISFSTAVATKDDSSFDNLVCTSFENTFSLSTEISINSKLCFSKWFRDNSS